ncbi:hypothetical protein ACVIGB_000505 [Bradyrhizobium sp. USDA 4341]
MIKLSMGFGLALLSISPLFAQTDNDQSRQSCFGPPNYCIKKFAENHDRDYHELCLLAEKVCRSYQYNWRFMRSLVKSNQVLNDCFPESIFPRK